MDETANLLDLFIFAGKGDDYVDPMVFFERLRELPEHQHLKDGEAKVAFFFNHEPIVKGGKQTLGTVYIPRIQGRLNGLFQWLLNTHIGYLPDFLVILDRTFWMESTDFKREILVYHEMKHMAHAKDAFGELRFDESDRPVWALDAHDIEEFHDTVRKYGAYSSDLRTFRGAMTAGDQDQEGQAHE